MEEKARDILRAPLGVETPMSGDLAAAVRSRFAPLGGVELADMEREPIRESLLELARELGNLVS